LTNVGIVDKQVSPAYGLNSGPDCPASAESLAPGGTVTCTATYTTTQSDLDYGTVTDSAVANGTPPNRITPIMTSPSTATVTAQQKPSLTVVKSASPSGPANLVVGQVITYSFLVTNSGNVTLHDVHVVDTQIAPAAALATAPACPSTTLAPGAQQTCTAAYKVAGADIANGTISDVAIAVGTPPVNPGSPSAQPVSSSASAVTVGILTPVSTPLSVDAGHPGQVTMGDAGLEMPGALLLIAALGMLLIRWRRLRW
jgi:hypothetical protein